MIRHTVLLTFVEGTDADVVDGIVASLSQLPERIPSIRSYVVATDLGLADGNATLAVHGEFDDVEGYVVYRDHPEHRAVIDTQIVPVLASRSAAQIEI